MLGPVPGRMWLNAPSNRSAAELFSRRTRVLPLRLDAVYNRDCIAGMSKLDDGVVDLAFADPPFNIGYDYDVYQDSLESENYIAWSRDWIAAVYRTLKPSGTFWLAIGDEYAAELKLASQKIGFHCRLVFSHSLPPAFTSSRNLRSVTYLRFATG